MRIAFCISGLVRSYRETYQNFVDTLIKPNTEHQIDIFISTWDVEQSNLSMVRTRQLCFGGLDHPPIPENPLDFNDIQAKYRPVLIEVDSQIDCRPPKFMDYEPDLKNLVAKINTQSFWFMLYKLYACDNLRLKREKLQGWEYDLVVRTRFDTTLPDPVILANADLEALTIPQMPHGPIYAHFPWIFDAFAMGNSKVMTTYSDWINSIEELITSGVPIQPESLLYAHLVKHEVPLNIVDFNVAFVR